jgi:hypothetical protein
VNDRNGKPITVGARVRFYCDSCWHRGIVRAVSVATYYTAREQRIDVAEAKVDDGDPNNADLLTNGFRVAACVESGNIVLEEGCATSLPSPPLTGE